VAALGRPRCESAGRARARGPRPRNEAADRLAADRVPGRLAVGRGPNAATARSPLTLSPPGAAGRRRGGVRAAAARRVLRRPALSLRDRDAEGHRRPPPHLALHLHAPAVRLDDAARDGEAEAGAGAAGAPCLPERVEEARALLLGDARPGVRHAEDDLVAVARR